MRLCRPKGRCERLHLLRRTADGVEALNHLPEGLHKRKQVRLRLVPLQIEAGQKLRHVDQPPPLRNGGLQQVQELLILRFTIVGRRSGRHTGCRPKPEPIQINSASTRA
mgnify:CR=1 FL=1